MTDKKSVHIKPENIQKYKLMICSKKLPNCRGYKIKKNVEKNKTKGMSMEETVLVLVKKIWVGYNLPEGTPARAFIEVPDTSKNT